MPVLREAVRIDSPNSDSAIQSRIAAGRSSWLGPLLLIVARSVFLIVGQALAALIFARRGDSTPWLSAGRYWTVYGTLADLACLALLWRFTKTEGMRFRDLLGPTHWRRGRDLGIGLGLCLAIFPLFILGGTLANLIAYGAFTAGPHPTAASAVHHSFPLWAAVYSLCIWWIIWTPTEQIAYQAYALPRVCALSRHRWIGLAIVGFWWSLQHSFAPFVPEWRYVIWRFVMVAPGIFAFMLVYLRIRRMVPVILAQCPMDILVAVMTVNS
jgi:hypothetical protein